VLPGYEADFLAPLSLRAIPGIGKRTAETLAEFNLQTVGQLAAIPQELLVRTFGEQAGQTLYRKARGQGGTDIELEQLPKSISRETTFEKDTDDRQFILAMLYYLTERACLKLRRLQLKARTVAVKLRYSDFKTHVQAKSLPVWTDQDDEVYALVRELLASLYTRRVQVRLVGVQVSHLSEHGPRQLHLWTAARDQRRRRLYAVSDRIRQRFGFSALLVGPAIELSQTLHHDHHGHQLQTPSLSQ
jgi:DNA polymerase-4